MEILEAFLTEGQRVCTKPRSGEVDCMIRRKYQHLFYTFCIQHMIFHADAARDAGKCQRMTLVLNLKLLRL
ncbi:MAG: hypothetical protein ACJAXM_000227 [Arenicella sp.]|jgi:hypothetical protein